MRAMKRIARGSDFLGVLKYVVFRQRDGRPQGRLLWTNLAHDSGKNDLSVLQAMAAEFEAVARRHPDVPKPVWHQTLRLNPEEATLDPDTWRRIALRYLEEMGIDIDKHQVAIYGHDGDHVHIIVNRVGLVPNPKTGRPVVYSGKHDDLRTSDILDNVLEDEFGLQATHTPDIREYLTYERAQIMGKHPALPSEAVLEAGRAFKAKRQYGKALSRGETRFEASTGVRAPRRQLQEILRRVLSSGRAELNVRRFARLAQDAGVTIKANVATTGIVHGLSFGFGGVSFKGSELGDGFKWSALSKRLRYDASIDLDFVRSLDGVARSAIPNTKVITAMRGAKQSDPRSWISRLRSALITAAATGSLKRFLAACDVAQITPIPSVTASGSMSGFSFRFEGLSVKGSDIDRMLSWRSLSKALAYDDRKGSDDVSLLTERLARERLRAPPSSAPKLATPTSTSAYDDLRTQHAIRNAELQSIDQDRNLAVSRARRETKEALSRLWELVRTRKLRRDAYRQQKAELEKKLADKIADLDELRERKKRELELRLPAPPSWLARKAQLEAVSRRDLQKHFECSRLEECSIIGTGYAPSLPVRDIRSFTAKQVRPGTDVEYRSPTDGTLLDTGAKVVFKDPFNRTSILAALQLGNAKWPNGFWANGSPAFKRLTVQVAVQNGLDHLIKNRELRYAIAEARDRRTPRPRSNELENAIFIPGAPSEQYVKHYVSLSVADMVEEAIRRLPKHGLWTITGSPEWRLEVAREIAHRPELGTYPSFCGRGGRTP